jgi:hypothetical protein
MSEFLLIQNNQIYRVTETDSNLSWLIKRWLVLCLKNSHHLDMTSLMLNCLDTFVNNTHTIEYLTRKGKFFWSLFTLPTCGIFAFFLARQPQGVLLHGFPPLKPCANESLVILDIDATLTRP